MIKEGTKKEGGASVYVLGVFIFVLLFVVYLCNLQTENMNSLQKDFDTGILISLLGSANINVEEYGRTGNRIIHETYSGDADIWGAAENALTQDEYLSETLILFQNLLQSNLGLNSSWQSNKTIVLSPVVIEEFKVFNVYENQDTGDKQIYEFTWVNGAWSVQIHGVNEKVYVAGSGDRGTAIIEVEDTTLYAHISFDITVLPYLSSVAAEQENNRVIRVHMARNVSIPGNETY